MSATFDLVSWEAQVAHRCPAGQGRRLASVLKNLGGDGAPFAAGGEALGRACGLTTRGGAATSFTTIALHQLCAAGLVEIVKKGHGGKSVRPTVYRLTMPEVPAVAPGSAPAQPAAASTPPRPLNPAARRLINDRLDDVYDPETGYVDAWTDKRVAEAVGVPLAWVAEVRELMFGPLKVNPALAAEAAAAIEIVNRAAAQVAEMKSERAALAGLLAEMDQKCVRIEGDLGAAMAAVRRIEEAVRP